MSEKMKIVIATAEVNRDAVEEILRKLSLERIGTQTRSILCRVRIPMSSCKAYGLWRLESLQA